MKFILTIFCIVEMQVSTTRQIESIGSHDVDNKHLKKVLSEQGFDIDDEDEFYRLTRFDSIVAKSRDGFEFNLQITRVY